jgi:hypothetical protein
MHILFHNALILNIHVFDIVAFLGRGVFELDQLLITMSCVVSLEINDVQPSDSVRAHWVSDRERLARI